MGNPELCWQLANLARRTGEPINGADMAIGKLQELKGIVPSISLQ